MQITRARGVAGSSRKEEGGVVRQEPALLDPRLPQSERRTGPGGTEDRAQVLCVPTAFQL